MWKGRAFANAARNGVFAALLAAEGMTGPAPIFEGALGFTASTQVQAAPMQVEVIDTVGAGDTFQGALLTWLAERDALSANALAALTKDAVADALGFAARAAAITCSRRGADMPRRAEL